jgi:TolA-binding protein
MRAMAETFRTLLREYPKSDSAGQAHYYLGTAAYEAKDFPNARTEFETAAKVSPKEHGPRAALRVILCDYQLQDSTRLAADLDTYRRAKYSPEPPAQVLRWLGERQLESKNYLEAETNLALAAASPADDAPDTFLKLARCRLLLKRPEPALDAVGNFLKKTGSTDPGARANGLLVQGEALLALKRFDDAQKSADEALLLQPEGPLNARGRLLGGDVAFGRGQFEAAAKAYSGLAILTDDPDVTPQALRRAAEAYEKAGKPAQAAEALRELRARFPNFATAGT